MTNKNLNKIEVEVKKYSEKDLDKCFGFLFGEIGIFFSSEITHLLGYKNGELFAVKVPVKKTLGDIFKTIEKKVQRGEKNIVQKQRGKKK